MIFVGGVAFAQDYSAKHTKAIGAYSIKPAFKLAGTFNKIMPVQPLITTQPLIILYPVSYSLISPNYYTQNFGFFCKKELQLEKITKIPFKFRLGSVQQCDWMEGKFNAGLR